MVRDNRHDSAYLFGAICPARRVGAAIIMPAVNTEAMAEHLKEISAQVAHGARAVLVCDGAGWHQQGGALCVPDNELRVCAARSRRRSSVGRTRGVGRRLSL